MEHQGDFFNETVLGMNPLSADPSSGKPMPHNDEILSKLTTMRNTISEQRARGKLDNKGIEIANALDQLLRTTQAFIQEKNSDEAFQRFIEDCISFSSRAKAEAKTSQFNAPGTKDTAIEQLSNISGHLKSIVQQFFTSTDTRNMLRAIEQFIENCYDMNKKLREGGSAVSQTGQVQRRDMVRSMMTLLSKVGKTPSWKRLRHDVQAMYDYFISDKQQVNPQLQAEFSKLVDRAVDLLNRFTGDRDLFTLKQMMENTYNEVRKDPEAQDYLTRWRRWADFIVENPDSIDKESTVNEGDQIVEQGLRIYDRHSDKISSLSEELRLALRSLQKDKYLTMYKENVADVGRSMKGSYLNSIVQLRSLLAPMIGQILKETKLPRIESRDASSSWSLDNINIYGKESHLEDISMDIRIGLKDLIQAVVTVKDVDITLKDVDFTYDRTSMPSFSDKGKVDVRIVAPRWRMMWIVNQSEAKPFFELSDVDGKISKLDISVTQANHSMIDSIVIKMWAPVLRRKVQSSIEEALSTKSQPITDKLNQFLANDKTAESTSHPVATTEKPSLSTFESVGETKPATEKTIF